MFHKEYSKSSRTKSLIFDLVKDNSGVFLLLNGKTNLFCTLGHILSNYLRGTRINCLFEINSAITQIISFVLISIANFFQHTESFVTNNALKNK